MIVGLVGVGAIGTLFGAALATRADVRVLVHRTRDGRDIASRGGLVVDAALAVQVRVGSDPSVLTGAAIVLIAVKTYATAAALEPLRAAGLGSAALVSLQNGAEAVARIEFALGHRDGIALAPTTEAAALVAPGVARRTGTGTTRIGWAAGHAGDDDLLEQLVATLADAGLDVARAQPIEPYVWAKLVANAAINPVTALEAIPNGELLERPAARERAHAIAREVAAVARAAGIVLPIPDPAAHVDAVARATAPNRSSMLADFDAGRPTEIDAIAGAVVRRAAELGVAVPQTERALDEVRARSEA